MSTYTYTVIFEYFKDGEAEGYNVAVPAIPGIVTWGRDMDEAQANAEEAIQCHLEGLLKSGESIPNDISVAEPVRIARLPISV